MEQYAFPFCNFSVMQIILPNILGGGVPHGSQNPDPISDQNVWFCIPLFRPDPEYLYHFSDLSD